MKWNQSTNLSIYLTIHPSVVLPVSLHTKHQVLKLAPLRRMQQLLLLLVTYLPVMMSTCLQNKRPKSTLVHQLFHSNRKQQRTITGGHQLLWNAKAKRKQSIQKDVIFLNVLSKTKLVKPLVKHTSDQCVLHVCMVAWTVCN